MIRINYHQKQWRRRRQKVSMFRVSFAVQSLIEKLCREVCASERAHEPKERTNERRADCDDSPMRPSVRPKSIIRVHIGSLVSLAARVHVRRLRVLLKLPKRSQSLKRLPFRLMLAQLAALHLLAGSLARSQTSNEQDDEREDDGDADGDHRPSAAAAVGRSLGALVVRESGPLLHCV